MKQVLLVIVLDGVALMHLAQEHKMAHKVVVADGNVSACFKGHMHLVPLRDQFTQSHAHRHCDVVGLRAESQHAFGIGQASFRAGGVVGVRFASGPPCDGVLNVVEDLNVDVIC